MPRAIAADYVRKVRNRAHDLPSPELAPLDRAKAWNRPRETMVQESAGDEAYPTATTMDRTDAQIDRPPEPAAIHQVDKAIGVLLWRALGPIL